MEINHVKLKLRLNISKVWEANYFSSNDDQLVVCSVAGWEAEMTMKLWRHIS